MGKVVTSPHQAQVWQSAQQRFESDASFKPCECGPDTKMNALSEGQMRSRIVTSYIELLGVGKVCIIAIA